MDASDTLLEDRRIGDVLVARGCVSALDLVAAVARQRDLHHLGQHVRLCEVLVQQGLAAPEAIRAALQPLSPSSAREAAPQASTLGRFRLRGLLGEGAMGAVYLAHDPELDRPVAIKVLRAQQHSVRGLARMRQEAQAAARLRHPGIVTIYEVALDSNPPYLVLEAVDGATLADEMRRLPRKCLLEVLEDVAAAVHAAHQLGVLHRDLKPDNILLERATGQPRIVDFGVAALAGVDAQGRLTLTGEMVGTPCYMAPEQWVAGQEGEVGPTADVYSLGVILYEGLTGSLPFDPSSRSELFMQVAAAPPPSPRSINPSIPKALEAVCLRALSKDPARRYPTAAAFGEALVAAQREPLPRRGGVLAVATLLLVGLGLE